MGYLAQLGDIPYQVSLQRNLDSKNICGGAILNENWIITAGQCVNEKRPAEIYAKTGLVSTSADGPRYKIQLTALHPNYQRQDAENNIALLRTTTPIIFNEFTKAINISLEMVEPSELVTLSGWEALEDSSGTASGPELLQSMTYRTIPFQECNQKMLAAESNLPIYFRSSLCALATIKSGSCAGDIGSPLVAKGLLIGIHLFHTGCAEEYPNVSLQVYPFLSWINTMMTAQYQHSPTSRCLCRSPYDCFCGPPSPTPTRMLSIEMNFQ